MWFLCQGHAASTEMDLQYVRLNSFEPNWGLDLVWVGVYFNIITIKYILHALLKCKYETVSLLISKRNQTTVDYLEFLGTRIEQLCV